MAAPAGCDGWPEFLVVFAHHNMYFNMRFQELEALAELVGVASREALYVDRPAPTALSASPLALVRLPSEEAARKLCERAVLIKAVLEVWSTGPCFRDAVAAALAAGPSARELRRRAVAPPRRFQVRIEAFGRTVAMEDKKVIFDDLAPLWDGDEVVDLRDPDTTVWALEEHSHVTGEKTHLGPRQGLPQRVFLARQVAGGRSVDKKLKSGEKAYFQKYDLTQRAVLGPTTLDNELAFIMANCAQVQRGSSALEPFCGTGGIMLAVAHFGAHVTAGEIDIRVVKGWRVAYTKNKDAALEASAARGRGPAAARADSSSPASAGSPSAPGAEASAEAAARHVRRDGRLTAGYLAAIGLAPELADGGLGAPTAAASSTAPPPRGDSEPGRDIFTNFVQYQLRLPEVVVCDNASRPWRRVRGGWCDCIVTDPPYGVRAASKKQGRSDAKPVAIRDMSGEYIPPKVAYCEEELADDLMGLAAEALRDGGRIVFLQPVDLADFLGIDRAAVERGGGPKGNLHEACHPQGGRKKDPRLCISETTRDPLLLDESRYTDYLPSHEDLVLVGASLQILSGGLGRLLVTMRRKPR